jgi:gluconolactonase
MKSKALFFALLMVLSSEALSQRQDEPAADTIAPNIPGVVAGGTKVQVVKDGFVETEGPIGLPDGGIIFTETRTSKLIKIDKDGNTSTFLENTNRSNGLAFDSKGRLISAQLGPEHRRVGVIYPKGREAVLADNFEGKPFSFPNDVVVNKKGGVYFTDSGPVMTPGTPRPPLPPAVYYIAPGGKVMKVYEAQGTERPNGIQLSPDEKTLYVNDWIGEYLLAFDIERNGTVRHRRRLARYEGVIETPRGVNSGADGLVVDSQGRLYSATNAGIEVFSPQGQHLGTIPISRKPQNLAFAGAGKKTLYVVGHFAAFKIQMLAQGPKNRAK